jgi:hypothetical protein
MMTLRGISTLIKAVILRCALLRASKDERPRAVVLRDGRVAASSSG